MDKKFKIGDVVYVSGNVRYKDTVGEVVDLSRNADFVVVKLYGVDGGNRSFHASDLTAETEEQAEKREEKQENEEIEIYFAFYNEEDHKGWIGKIRKSEVDGRTKWREVRLKGEDSDRDWGSSTYMSYLAPNDLMSWVEKDYGRNYEVRGPFESRDEARQFMKKKFMLDESVITEARKFKPGDLVHLGYTNRNGSGVVGKLEKIEGGYAYVSVKRGNKEETVKGYAAYLSLSEGLIEQQTYSVGDKVETFIGGKWLPATITKPPHKETGNYGVRLKIKTTVVNTVSEPSQIRPLKENALDELSSLDLNLSTCDLLEAWLAIEQLYDEDEALLIFEALKEVRSQLNEGYGENNKGYQDWIKAVRKKHPNATLTGTEHQAQMIDWTTKNNKLCGEWDGKRGVVLEAGPFSYGAKTPRKGTLAAEIAVRRKKEDAKLGNFEIKDDMVGTAKRIKDSARKDALDITRRHTEKNITEQEMLARMIKHVSDKRNFRNTNTGLDDAAIADAKKTSKGQKSFDGINYKNDVALMKDLLASGKRIAKKERDLAKQYDQYNKQGEKGKTPKLPVGIKKYQDYLSKGKSIPGGRVVKHSTSGFSDVDADDGGDGRLTPTNTALATTVEHFHNFLHHIAEEELLSCKVIHIEAEGDQVVFYAECRDDPRSEGFQKDLTDKLQARLNRHTFPGVGVVNCKVIHIHPAKDKIAK